MTSATQAIQGRLPGVFISNSTTKPGENASVVIRGKRSISGSSDPLYIVDGIPVVGGIYVLETLSVIIQVTSFKLTGKRVFKMAPVHHHFEKCGWSEVKIVTVFSLITAVLCLIGFLAL